MSRTTRRRVNRRQFLKDGTGAVIAVGCFTTVGLRQALAAAQNEGKPLLTEREINAHLLSLRKTGAFGQAVEAVKQSGLFTWLGDNFHLTVDQKNKANVLAEESMKALNKALDRAVRENLRVIVRVIPDSTSRFDLKPQFVSGALVIRARGKAN